MCIVLCTCRDGGSSEAVTSASGRRSEGADGVQRTIVLKETGKHIREIGVSGIESELHDGM
jgi:hypothetical protein